MEFFLRALKYKYWALCGSVIFWFIISRALWCCGLFLCLSFEYFTLQNFWFSCHSIHLIFLLNLSSEPILCCFFCAFHKVSYMYMWVRHDLNLLTCAVCTYIYRLLWMRVELSEENKNGVKWIAIRFHVHWRFLLNEWNSPYLSLSLLLCDYGSGSGSVYINVAHIWERNIDGDMYMLTWLDSTRRRYKNATK